MSVPPPSLVDCDPSERPGLLRAVRRRGAPAPEHGILRVDYCGVLMVVSEPARGVEAQRILFERLTGYRNKQGQQWGLPVWEFAKKVAGR
jgi:hypothetical protein